MKNQSKNGKCPKCKKCCKTVPAEKTENDNFEKDLKMLEYYQNEFNHRNEHFWKLLIKFFILVCVIALLPICKEILGVSIVSLSEKYYGLFIIVAIVVAIYGGFILLEELKAIRIINDTKYKINKQMDEKYRYIEYHTALESSECY